MVLALVSWSWASLFSEALLMVHDSLAEDRARWRGVTCLADDIAPRHWVQLARAVAPCLAEQLLRHHAGSANNPDQRGSAGGGCRVDHGAVQQRVEADEAW
jgi:hypothetical protein